MSLTNSYVELGGEKVFVDAKGNLEIYSSLVKISDIKGLDKLQGLKSLWIVESNLSSMCGFEGLTSLKELHIIGNEKLRKIEGLESLVNLELLNLCSNRIEHIANLEKLTNLKTLIFGSDNDCPGNPLCKIEGLDTLEKLEELAFYECAISKIEGLDNLKNLKRLYLTFNCVNKISGLDSLLNLESLCLSFNKIERIEGLDNLRKLKKLHLNGNKISKIEGFDNLVNLKVLGLFNNPLKGLEHIKRSHMGNDIALEDISPYLRNLVNLEDFNGKKYPDSDIYPI